MSVALHLLWWLLELHHLLHPGPHGGHGPLTLVGQWRWQLGLLRSHGRGWHLLSRCPLLSHLGLHILVLPLLGVRLKHRWGSRRGRRPLCARCLLCLSSGYLSVPAGRLGSLLPLEALERLLQQTLEVWRGFGRSDGRYITNGGLEHMVPC